MRREAHSRARLVAPILFLAAFTIAVLLVRSGLSGGDDAVPPAGTALATRATTAAPPPARKKAKTGKVVTTLPEADGQLYEIQAGDTLELVAARFGTTIERLLVLNPDVDPVALRIGQTIRVK